MSVREMSSQKEIKIEPIINYPSVAAPGESYLMTVDLRPQLGDGEWPYDGEEYVVNCHVDGGELFQVEPLGDGTVVVHRFGGTYGAARFVLTAGDEVGEGYVRVGLVNGWGVPLGNFDLKKVQIEYQGRKDKDIVQPSEYVEEEYSLQQVYSAKGIERLQNEKLPLKVAKENQIIELDIANDLYQIAKYLFPTVIHYLKSRQSQVASLRQLSALELEELAENFIYDMFVMKLLPNDYALLELFSGQGNFRAWVKRVQINFIADQLRKDKARTKKDTLLSETPAISPEKRGTLLSQSSTESPEVETLIKETLADIDYCVERLSPSYHDIYEMYFIEELSVSDITDRLNRTIPQVLMLIHHTRKSLQICLKGRSIDSEIFNELF